ncbi:MAG: D-alanyl-D-alanine carboxypeptidase [Clostridia bacterium]|nr:D-alanyl-D-alanine carboxypeptidase [Clostridia bacterium]
MALAEYTAGSVEEFANLMNKKAKELELKDTHFVTPHGLDESEHYTTAYELAKIADYALNIEEIANIVKTKSYTVNINGNPKNINNTNELLRVFRRCVWCENRIY